MIIKQDSALIRNKLVRAVEPWVERVAGLAAAVLHTIPHRRSTLHTLQFALHPAAVLSYLGGGFCYLSLDVALPLHNTHPLHSEMACLASTTAVEQIWHIEDSQGQILALTFRSKSLRSDSQIKVRSKLFPHRSAAAS